MTVTIDEDSIRNTVSVDRATVVPMAKKMLAKHNKTQIRKADAEREETLEGDTKLEEQNVVSPQLRRSFPQYPRLQVYHRR